MISDLWRSSSPLESLLESSATASRLTDCFASRVKKEEEGEKQKEKKDE